MIIRKIVGYLFAALILLFVEATANAQCFSGDDFAICPAQDTVYLLNATSIGAMASSNGKIKWLTKLPHETDETFTGPVATADSVVIFGGVPLTRIRAFDAVTGKPTWGIEASSDDWTSAGPYVLFEDREHWEGLTALNGKTGKIVWHHTASKPGQVGFTDFSGRVLLTNLFAIDVDTGQVLQRWPKEWRISTAVFAGPYVAIGTEDGGVDRTKLAVYSWPGYKMLWSRRDATRTRSNSGENMIVGIAGDAHRLLVATYDDYAFHPGNATLEWIAATTGKTIWSKKIAVRYMLLPSPVALIQGLAIFAMADSANSGVVEAFDAETGEQRWIAHTNQRLTSGPVCDGRDCYIGSVSHEVLAIDVSSGAQSWLSIPKE